MLLRKDDGAKNCCVSATRWSRVKGERPSWRDLPLASDSHDSIDPIGEAGTGQDDAIETI
jgi:hypothetical protein